MIADLFVPVLTPFGPEGGVDVEALTAHCEWVVREGASGVMLFGTTGEGPSVSVGEKIAVARALVTAVPDLAVIGAVTENSVVDAETCIRGYNELGLVATLVLPPSYFREPATDGLRAFFEHLVPRSEHPVLAYHIPSLAPAVAVDIVADLGMWGAKDSGGDLAYTEAVLDAGKDVMVGAESTIPDAMLAGAAGTIAGMGNLLPRELATLCASVRAGDIVQACRLRDEVLRVQRAVLSGAPGAEWVAAMKAVARHRHGIDLGAVRLPLRARREYVTDAVSEALDAAAGALPATP